MLDSLPKVVLGSLKLAKVDSGCFEPRGQGTYASSLAALTLI